MRMAWMIAMTSAMAMSAAMPVAPLAAQMPGEAAAPVCTVSAPLPPELAGFAAHEAVMAAADAKTTGKAVLTLGTGAEATLSQTSDVRYLVRPEKPGGSVSYGGMFSFTVTRAGTYRVALGSGAWIDLLKGKTALPAAAHGHGPACTGVRKMVDFVLTPGRYTLQIAANGSPTLALMVTPIS